MEDFKVPLEEKIKSLLSVLKDIREMDEASREQWELVMNDLSIWYQGRVEMTSFIIEKLTQYLEEE